ncbi:MAG TPA: amino acid permease [Burkholderiales bacterium]|jgi:amino acid transporter|nr:amino acid permease [Burkholderiales bacterium]
MSEKEPAGTPARVLTLKDAIFLTVGIVVGAGIFKAPSLVAGAAGSLPAFVIAWVLGGAVSMIGALCYAELACAFPSAGGDYHFLARAYGKRLAFLFAWARITVIATGSIALLAFVFGDYCAQIWSLGEYGSSIYAVLVVLALTGINYLGTRQGATAQNWFTSVEVLGLFVVIAAALLGPGAAPAPAAAAATAAAGGPLFGPGFGFAMVMVLLTFGGWNEAAYISAEVAGDKRVLARTLIISITVLTVLYLAVNLAYLYGLGLAGMAKSDAVAADLLQAAWGTPGAKLLSAMVAISAFTSINSTVIVGARSAYSTGRDWPALAWLGKWDEASDSPRRALIVQAVITLVLIAVGTFTRNGFETMVNFTAPVFWFFFLLTGISLFVLRTREPQAERPFRVPFYPLTPILFCAACAYLLYSSVDYASSLEVRSGTLLGVGLLGIGAIAMLLLKERKAD